jgi:ubiquinone/menaquinone biosynthesis C-methylase UbiE
VRALQEMCRVLKPSGKALIIDLKGNASPEELSREVDGMRLKWMNRILTKLAFRTMLLKRAYTKEQFQQMLAETSFKSVDIQESNIGLEISMIK